MNPWQNSLGKLRFSFPVLNAAGVWCTTEKQLKDVLESEAGGVTFKSMTLKPREGNPDPRLFYTDSFSINSMGLPNKGVNYYVKIAEKLKRKYKKKPFVASIAGFSKDEFHELFERVNNESFDAIEVNLSCPNVSGKSIFAYDMEGVGFKVLSDLRKKTSKVLGVKLPPYVSRGEVKEIAEELVKIGIDFVTLINSYPLSTAIDYKSETMRIKPNMGIGGLGGPVLKPIALAQVVLFHQYSQGKLKIIGAGGIKRAEDIYQYVLAGASVVEVATAILQQEGPKKTFSKLKKELTSLLKAKKVHRLSTKVGKLKFL